MRRPGLAGIGSAVLLVAIAAPAGAATDVVIPLEPSEVLLSAVPAEYLATVSPASGAVSGVMTSAVSASAAGLLTAEAAEPVAPLEVAFSGTLTIELPPEFDTTEVEADLEVDVNQAGLPEKTYSSEFPAASPEALTLTGQGTSNLVLNLPVDDPTIGDEALLTLTQLDSTLGPEFLADPVFYALAFTATAPAARTVEPVLAAFATYPCDATTFEPCPFPTRVTPGSTVDLELTAGSLLREIGFADLSGAEVGLIALDADGVPVGEDVLTPPVQAAGSTASFALPGEPAVDQYALLVLLENPAGRVAVVQTLLTVADAEVPAAPTTEAPPTQAPVVNPGLRSNTGVVAPTAVEDGGSASVVAGAGLLLLAGSGGVAVARTRRRSAIGAGEA